MNHAYSKLILSLTLIVGLILQLGFNLVLVASYELQTDYFATELCEKKAVANNHCNGKCFMKDRFEEQNTQNSGHPIAQYQNNEVLLYIGTTTICSAPSSIELSSPIAFTINFYSLCEQDGVFHPPQFS